LLQGPTASTIFTIVLKSYLVAGWLPSAGPYLPLPANACQASPALLLSCFTPLSDPSCCVSPSTTSSDGKVKLHNRWVDYVTNKDKTMKRSQVETTKHPVDKPTGEISKAPREDLSWYTIKNSEEERLSQLREGETIQGQSMKFQTPNSCTSLSPPLFECNREPSGLGHQ
jgi:hypothetical protein